jgi:hypothetical protein
MYRLSFLFTRTAILLYVFAAGDVALYNGWIGGKQKQEINVCFDMQTAVINYVEDNQLVNAVVQSSKKK